MTEGKDGGARLRRSGKDTDPKLPCQHPGYRARSIKATESPSRRARAIKAKRKSEGRFFGDSAEIIRRDREGG